MRETFLLVHSSISILSSREVAGALHRSTFATREIDDDDDDVRVVFNLRSKKKKIRYTLVVIKTDVFFFDKTVVFSNSHFTSTYDEAKKRTPL